MTLYDSDFFAWTQDQAGRLRRLLAVRSNVDLDLENLAEEIESMGGEQADAVESALAQIIEHMLKLQHSPAQDPRAGWRQSVRKQRTMIARKLKRNPSLASRNRLSEMLADAWKDGRKLAVGALRDYGEADAATEVPTDCPYTVEQLLDDDWWPAD